MQLEDLTLGEDVIRWRQLERTGRSCFEYPQTALQDGRIEAFGNLMVSTAVANVTTSFVMSSIPACSREILPAVPVYIMPHFQSRLLWNFCHLLYHAWSSMCSQGR